MTDKSRRQFPRSQRSSSSASSSRRRLQALPVLVIFGGFRTFLVPPPVWPPRLDLPHRRIQRHVSVESSLAVALPAAVAKGRFARTLPTINWLKVAVLLIIQMRVVPRAVTFTRKAWRRLKEKTAMVLTNDELTLVQEALGDEQYFQTSMELEDGQISEGMKVLNSWQEIQEAKLPLTLRFYQPRARPAWMKSKQVSHWLRSMDLARDIFLRALGPSLLWGWSTLGLTVMAGLFSQTWSRREFAMYRACLEKFLVVPSWTAVAWFLHRLVLLWGQRVSRGRAELSDVMGMQSSLREARINALQTSMKVLIWATYLFALLWHGGVQISQLLLIPGTTAVVIGWVGREIVCNMISGVVLHLTQPFAQGDWISLTGEDIDGWVQDVGSFYTKVIQWDKRPIYVPNGKLMSMNVQNNSRMTHRRIKYELKLRLRDIPKIPTIVRDIQDMIGEHEDIDNVQHQLVRWRGVGEFSADIWLSCYTKPSIEGIRLKSYTATQQSILERCSQIVYKHDAAFASSTDRIQYAAGGNTEGSKSPMQIFKDTFNTARESQLESREEVLRQREKDIKELERELEQKSEEQAKAQKEIQLEKEKLAKELQMAQKQDKKARGEVLQDAAVLAEGAAAAADWENEEMKQQYWFERPTEDVAESEVFKSREPVTESKQEDGEHEVPHTKETTASERKEGSELHSSEASEGETPESSKGSKGPRSRTEPEGFQAADMDSESHEHEAKDNEGNVESLSQEQTSETLAAVIAENDDEAERLRIPVKEMGD